MIIKMIAPLSICYYYCLTKNIHEYHMNTLRPFNTTEVFTCSLKKERKIIKK